MLGWVINDDTHWAYIGEEEMEKAKAAIQRADRDMSVFVSIWIYKPYTDTSLSSGRYKLFIEDYFLLDKIDRYVRRFDSSTDDPDYLREALPLLWKEGGWWGLC